VRAHVHYGAYVIARECACFHLFIKRLNTHMYTYIYVYIYKYIHSYMCIYIYIHIYIFMYAHSCIYV